jgi:deoxyxylulose-5-phosphate synthase
LAIKKITKTDQVVVAFFGDGASNRGAFHEALNWASIYNLPILFVVEYNNYASTISSKNSTSVENISERAAGYNIEGINSIMRFDISKFLHKMDNSRKDIFILKKNTYKEIYGERVYHINLVIKYITYKDTVFKKFRIVLNRNGIKRIEEVFSEKENSS